MSTELVEIWCRPGDRGDHKLGTVVADVAEGGIVYLFFEFRAKTTHRDSNGQELLFASDDKKPLVDNASTMFSLWCPGCRAPFELNSGDLLAWADEARREQRTTRKYLDPSAALKSDELWQMADKLNRRPDRGSLYPEDKKTSFKRRDPRIRETE